MTPGTVFDPELLNLLCCPETHQPLRLADSAILEELNQKIKAGQVRTRSGRLVNEKITQALLRADGKILFPVRNEIPVMLMDEAISLT